jgi:hypothetical protein
VEVELAPERVREPAEGLLVPAHRPLEQLLAHGLLLVRARPLDAITLNDTELAAKVSVRERSAGGSVRESVAQAAVAELTHGGRPASRRAAELMGKARRTSPRSARGRCRIE